MKRLLILLSLYIGLLPPALAMDWDKWNAMNNYLQNGVSSYPVNSYSNSYGYSGNSSATTYYYPELNSSTTYYGRGSATTQYYPGLNSSTTYFNKW